MRALPLVSLLLVASPAFASGGVWCEVSDDKIDLSVELAMARQSGAVFGVEGRLILSDPAIPADLARLTLTRDDLAQIWSDGEEFRLALWRERTGEDWGALSLVIRAKAAEEGEYRGDYEITLSGSDPDAEIAPVGGPVSCYYE